MATIETYELASKFQIRSIQTEWGKGYFFFSRFVWNIRVERGKWWQMFSFHVVEFFILMPIALSFDLMVALVKIIIILIKLILVKSIELFFEVLKMIFQVVINVFGKVIAWILVVSSISVIAIVLIYNWENITSLINNLIGKFF